MSELKELEYVAFPSKWARKLNWRPDPWQQELLDSEQKQIIVNCSRQVGKSTSTAVKVAHRGLYTPGALIILLAPSERQSIELMHKAKGFIEAEGVGVERLTRTQAEFSNGSRIFALPGKEATVRGYSGADLVVIDEASRVPDDLYYTIRPMLAVGNGQVILLSTPWGKRGFFHNIWMGDNNDGWHWPWKSGHPEDKWQRLSVNATECPRITEEFLEQERTKMPAYYFKQEYMCEFAETQDSVFNYDDIMAAFTEEKAIINPTRTEIEFTDEFKAMTFK